MSNTFHKNEERLPSFPVIQSLLSPQTLVTEVLSDYDIGQGVDCKLLSHNLNDTYLVSVNERRYILRVSQAPRSTGRTWRLPAEILYELDLLLHLSQSGVPVSTPVVRKDGTYLHVIQASEGPRPVVLFTYAPGDPVTPSKQHPSLSRLYGRAVAEIHTASSDFASPSSRFQLDLAFLIDTPLQTIQPLLAHRADDWNYLLWLADSLKEHFTLSFAQSLETGICHGDAQGGNAHLSKEKGLTFFDFDVCGHGWRAYDLAVFYWGAALGKSRLGWDEEQVERVWRAYLEGYLERRPLSELDLQAIPFFVAIRHFWFLGLHTANWDYWGLGTVDDQFFDRELAFLREWVSQRIKLL